MSNYIKKLMNRIGLFTEKDLIVSYENGRNAEKDGASKLVDTALQRNKELSGELDRMKAAADENGVKMLSMQEEAADCIHNEQEALAKLKLANAEVKKLNKRIELLRKDNSGLASEIDKQASDIADLTAEADKLRHELSDAAPKLEEYKRTVIEMGDEIEGLKYKIVFVTAERDEWQEAYAKLSKEKGEAKPKKAAPKKKPSKTVNES